MSDNSSSITISLDETLAFVITRTLEHFELKPTDAEIAGLTKSITGDPELRQIIAKAVT